MSATIARPEPIRWRKLFAGQYGPLLTSLLVLCIAAPGMTGGPLKGGLIDVANALIVLTGIFAANPGRRSAAIGVGLMGLVLAVHRTIRLSTSPPLHGLHYALILAILTYAMLSILSAVVRDALVTIETIKGAVCVYFLIGLAWVYIYALIDLRFPGSFRIPESAEGRAEGMLLVRRQLPRLLYFSFCTLTTVGYGDIVPLKGYAQTACYLEAVFGQIFLTVLVARLVGMHITHASRGEGLFDDEPPAPRRPGHSSLPRRGPPA